ncbi:MAG: response regulator transcription factor [Anaerolineae bacterium]|nr:response regulator transcription factor [Anaerolineae bacterium]
MNNSIKVSIVDNDDLFRRRARAWLEGTNGITVVGEAKEERQAIALIRETRPDVILLDISARPANDLQTMGHICELFPDAKIIVLNGEGQEQLALEAFKKGALGHLVKEKVQPIEMVKAICAVSRGEAVLSPGIAGCILDEVMQERRHSAPQT